MFNTLLNANEFILARLPEAYAPFDPIASKHADENGIEVAIMNGKNLANLANYIEGKEFLGTVIK